MAHDYNATCAVGGYLRCGFIEPCRDWTNPATTKPERTEPVHCNEGRQRGRDETEVIKMTGRIAKGRRGIANEAESSSLFLYN